MMAEDDIKGSYVCLHLVTATVRRAGLTQRSRDPDFEPRGRRMPSLWHGSRVRLGVGAEWALMVALVAIQGKGPVLDTVEDAR